MKHLLLRTIVSVKDILTCELVSISEQKVMRVAMFVMGGLLLALGVWKIPTLDLGLSGLIIGWMALTVVVGQCIVAGLLSGRYRLERGFRINGQIKAVENQFKSKRQVISESGGDLEDVFKDIKRDEELAENVGLEKRSE